MSFAHEPQVIRFTMHNPAAPNVRCSMVGAYGRCHEAATWAWVVERDDAPGNYGMLPFCEPHARAWRAAVGPAEREGGAG